MNHGPVQKVVLVGLNSYGYRSLALGYVRAFAQADQRLAGKTGFMTLDLDVSVDPWWVAYRVAGLAPDVVGFSVACWNARSVYDACRLLRRILPETYIVVGGPEVSPIAEEVLHEQHSIDAVVRGEGEETFAELLSVLLRQRSPWRVEGVTARRDGEVVSAPDRPLIGDLDAIPSPYLTGVLEPVEGTAYIETYRGCPHRCGYCFEGKGFGRIRSFSHERVQSEVAFLADSAGLGSFTFIDPVFNLTPDRLAWLSGVMEPYARRGVRLHTVEVDIERIGADEAALLKRAGVVSVETGPQTIGGLALKTCRRGFDRERFVAGVAALKEADIVVECDLIVGLPGDTADDVLAGMRFVAELDPGMLQMSTLHVLPGTDLWMRAEEVGLSFDPSAPHEAISTMEIPFSDLRRLEVMGNALMDQYRARV
ncbi:MAG: radical SAM protein [Coriobacteriia bacterium]|jgi:anaerobic magnesium-protoporphyrin IX monomethyl ester cyclase|nr:radical SAM protein [Coriobacteriia bacterium]